MAETIYGKIYKAINDMGNPIDIYNDNRAYCGYEKAKNDVKGLIVEIQTTELLGGTKNE